MKRCRKCKTEKPAQDFHRDRSSRDGLQGLCKSCQREHAKKWWPKNRHRKRGYALKESHHITLAEYESMLHSQNGLCAICGKPPSRRNVKEMLLHVDHNHKTGKIRGLLCNSCNRGIGLLGDNPDTLFAAEGYLRRCS